MSTYSFTLRLLTFSLLGLVLSACSDDQVTPETSVPDTATDAEREVDRGVGVVDDVVDMTETDTLDTGAAELTDTVGDTVLPDFPDISADAGFFPPEPEGSCVEDGNGVRGFVIFPDDIPLADATVALFVDGEKRLGILDDEGGFFIQAPCEEVFLEITTFESENFPAHPGIENLPLGLFDAGMEEPTFVVPLVSVEGLIVDVLAEPIPEARLDAVLEDGTLRIYNEQVADETGQFAVGLVPWPNAPYQLTASGPQDSDKRYRSVTLAAIVGNPPPDPATFTLYEDRCPAIGPVRTSEGTPLEWLYIRVGGEPYPDGDIIYYSFDPGFFYDREDPDVTTEEIPLFCGVQTLRIWNAVWVNPDWPCSELESPDQLCINNYPAWSEEELTAPNEDGIVIPVSRVRGLVHHKVDPDAPGTGTPLEDVIVRYEARYRWGPGAWDNLTVFNETITGETGHYSMVVLAYPDIEYTVTARIRDTDIRPLGGFTATVEVPGDTSFDIEMPKASPRCIMTGTVHSTEGRDFHELRLDWYGWNNDAGSDDFGDYMYVDYPMAYFSPEPNRYYRDGFPEEEISFVPLLCGDHRLRLHSTYWPGCNMSPDELCFERFYWWGAGLGFDDPNSVPINTPLDGGVELPVVHLSGFVTGPDGDPVEGVGISAMHPQTMFTFASNGTGTDREGLFDFVVLPDSTWDVSVSIGDDHPRLEELWPPDPITVEADEFGAQANIQMLEGPPRCPLSGTVTTSEGVELERLAFHFAGPYYGMMGWEFVSDDPGVYYRDGVESYLMEEIPLVCGVQTMGIISEQNPYRPSCFNPERFDQPCLEYYRYWNGQDIQEPVSGMEIPVAYLQGVVTENDVLPMENATITATGTVTVTAEDGTEVSLGSVSNHTLSRPDGTFRLALVPSNNKYFVEIETPLEIDLGKADWYVDIIEGEVFEIDANFSAD